MILFVVALGGSGGVGWLAVARDQNHCSAVSSRLKSPSRLARWPPASAAGASDAQPPCPVGAAAAVASAAQHYFFFVPASSLPALLFDSIPNTGGGFYHLRHITRQNNGAENCRFDLLCCAPPLLFIVRPACSSCMQTRPAFFCHSHA